MQKRRKIVAIVDDDPRMRRATENLLDASGFATELFASAEDFLDRGAKVDYLLLDIDLGGMSGIELQRQLRASGSKLPVVFMTGLDDKAILRQALMAGCISVACLRKPFTARQLIDAIAKAGH